MYYHDAFSSRIFMYIVKRLQAPGGKGTIKIDFIIIIIIRLFNSSLLLGPALTF